MHITNRDNNEFLIFKTAHKKKLVFRPEISAAYNNTTCPRISD